MKTIQQLALLMLALALIQTAFGQGSTALALGKQTGTNSVQESRSVTVPETNKTVVTNTEIKKPAKQSNNARALEIARAEIKASEEEKEKEAKNSETKQALKPEVPSANPVEEKEMPPPSIDVNKPKIQKPSRTSTPAKTTAAKAEKGPIGKKPAKTKPKKLKPKAKPATAKKHPIKKTIDKMKKKIGKKKSGKKAVAKKTIPKKK